MTVVVFCAGKKPHLLHVELFDYFLVGSGDCRFGNLAGIQLDYVDGLLDSQRTHLIQLVSVHQCMLLDKLLIIGF